MKTAVYLRQSKDRDKDELGISRQRKLCLELCKRKGWADAIEYVDNDTSATRGTRPAYQMMLSDIRDGGIGAVVVWQLDRLHRRPIELEGFIDLADKHNLALATVTGDVDLARVPGRLCARIIGSVARAEMEQKSYRHKVANRQKAENGKGCAVRSFGYDGNEVNVIEGQAIQQACRALLDSASLYGIAQQWNSAGIKTVCSRKNHRSDDDKWCEGHEWTGVTVRQVLLRPRNAGLAVYRGEVLPDAKAAWPAVIDVDTWEAVCALLRDEKRFTGRSRGRVHLLTGLLRCGRCGDRMGTSTRTTKRGDRRPVYLCKRNGCVTRDLAAVDEFVTELVCRRLSRPDAVKVFSEPTTDAKALHNEANRLRALIAAAENDYDSGIIDGRRLKGRIAKLQPQLDAIKDRLLGDSAARKLDGLLGNPDASEVFDGLSLDRRRAIIDAVVTVTLLPAGRPGQKFNADQIRVEWRHDG